MSAAPVLPPKPPALDRNDADRPPVPPLPPDFRADLDDPPLIAPRPYRFDLDLMSPEGTAVPFDDDPSVYRPPPNRAQSPWGITSPPPAFPTPQLIPPPAPAPAPAVNRSLNPAMAALSFSSPQQRQHPPPQQPPRQTSLHSPYSPTDSLPKDPPPPSLTAPLPTIPALCAAIQNVQSPNTDPAVRLAWCRDVFFLVDRIQQASAGASTSSVDPPVGPARIQDTQLQRLVQTAVPTVLQIAASAPAAPNPTPISAFTAEAIYLRATFAASGAYPDFVRLNPRTAFRDFEQAARAGYGAAWFKLGRDYENFNDFARARDCFERGVKLNVESCIYRMGMVHLMGQLGLPSSHERAVPLLHRAATLASVDVPQPAYVYALLLLDEFSHISISPILFSPFIPQGSSAPLEARKHLERAAYLNFAPAQYKLGHAYEFAQAPFPYDPLLSVQYYSLASQQGETEADMALSKWFLCGAEGHFEKDEALAYTFAEKAARKGLATAEFALGYYAEVGVGGPKDIDTARKWYSKAVAQGNKDALERLNALNQPAPQPLSRSEHDSLTEAKLVRKRTQAKQRSEAIAPSRAPSVEDRRQVVDVIRRNTAGFPPPHSQPPSQPQQPPPPQLQPPSQPQQQFPPQSQPPRQPQQPAYYPSPQDRQPGPDPQQQAGYLSEPRRPSEFQPPAAVSSPVSGRPVHFPVSSPLPGGQLGSPAPGSIGGPANGPSPRLRPQQPGQRPMSAYQRVSLVDPGFNSAEPRDASPARGQTPQGRPPRAQSPQTRPQMPRHVSSGAPLPRVDSPAQMPSQQQQAPQDAATPPARAPPLKGPMTFAEMGFQSAKPDDKDCVIM